MKTLKIFIFAILSFGSLLNCAAQTKSDNGETKITKTPQKIKERKPPVFDGDNGGAASLKIIAEGSNSNIKTPFVFVARTAETFAQLQKIVKNIANEKIDFNQTAVVAVFAGEKNTGGYTLAVEKNGDAISVKVVAPPKGGIVTQVLTTPYKIVAIEVGQENSLTLDLSADFSGAMKNYRLTSGEFEFSGGITGRRKSFAAAGVIKILTFGEYATAIFNLTGKANESRRTLNEIASGAIKNGKINLPRVEAGDFIDRPHSFLTATGNLSGNKLFLTFSPGKRDEIVNDAYAGGGKLTAVVINR